MSPPVVTLGLTNNVYVRQMNFEKSGDVEQGHTHNYDHLTLLGKGKLKVTANGNETTFEAPQMIWIRADTEHLLEALEDNTVAYCIHTLRDEQGQIIDPNMVPAGIELRNTLARSL